jgi:predicted nucleic acid-binding protein
VTLVDSNVLIDILSLSPQWKDRSASKLDECAARGPVYFDEIAFSELAVRSTSEAELNRALQDLGLRLHPIPISAYFLAGKTFGRYRDAGGPRVNILPDFFIGAHARIAGLPILTRDTRRYRTYFPDVELIAPQD